MIQYISRKKLDMAKYDVCIDQSLCADICVQSWYLDIAAQHWDCLVYDDYQVVMPVIWYKRMVIKQLYTPFFIVNSDIYFADSTIENKEEIIKECIAYLDKKFKVINANFTFNPQVYNEKKPFKILERQRQILTISADYATLKNTYFNDRKRNLKKVVNQGFDIVQNKDTDAFMPFYEEHIKTDVFKSSDFLRLKNLINNCLKRNFGAIYWVVKDNVNYTAAFVLHHKQKKTILLTVSDESSKKYSTTTLLYDHIIKTTQKGDTIDFAGSSLESIAYFFESFGAETKQYYHWVKPSFLNR